MTYFIKTSKWSEQNQVYKPYWHGQITKEEFDKIKINSDNDLKCSKHEIEVGDKTVIHYSLLSECI